ncbi:hypothetical protein NLJ89_g3056 [Agrocybe chaxingu]|uniref:Uncharacterized protein n=1 Tax=Agrocybe chaxingu TaxID=84603 RepID=A0A9W8KAD8_9AGAR|nr:hypothetical protein NLJ89_g3056 [Agrocybe chaxingu]
MGSADEPITPLDPSEPVERESPPAETGNARAPRRDGPMVETHPILDEFLYVEEEMSAGKIDKLLTLLATLYKDAPPFSNHQEMYAVIDAIQQGATPWNSVSVTYDSPRPENGLPIPPWMDGKYEIWYRDPLAVMEHQIGNPDFDEKMDFMPKRTFHGEKRRYRDLMSGNWAWEQADKIAEDESTHGAMFAPIILSSDKTTVSVATGQNDFYPLYASLGNVHNSVRRAHRNAVSLIGFLAIPKTSKEYADKADFRKFQRQLFHSSLEHILSPLHPYMTTPRVTRCCNGHYWCVIYGLGPYIADYPEQALLACIVQNWCPRCTAPSDDLDSTNLGGPRAHIHTDTLLSSGMITLQELWDDYGIVGDLLPFTTAFPQADIHKLLLPDLLHQIIKGTFKDHIVDWVEQYIRQAHSKAEAEKILADIDRRITAVPPFPGLRHFHEGQGFKQWTGNDSKGLMKVYLPAIAGHVPSEMVQAAAALIDFCYLVCCEVIDEDALGQIQATIDRFHRQREVFRELGTRPDGFSLLRQHSINHYVFLITQFGALNGLCSSITESKHIKAVKKPYRCSSRNKPLGQMLITNQRIDKIVAARADFTTCGMLSGMNLTDNYLAQLFPNPATLEVPPQAENDLGWCRTPTGSCNEVRTIDGTHRRLAECERDETGAVEEPEATAEIKLARTHVCCLPRDIYLLARCIRQPDLPLLTRRFLFGVLYPKSRTPPAAIPIDQLPQITGKVYVFNSARAVYYAPSDISGLGGMHHKRIRSVRLWYSSHPRYDRVFIGNSDSPDALGFRGLLVARVFLFFSFKHDGVAYPCALVHWFSAIGDSPDDETGMWVVEPDLLNGWKRVLEVVHLDTVLRGAHLIGVAGSHFLPSNPKLDFSMSLDAFKSFYVNKYADHHSHEIAF